ncbi:hypothetical protein PSCICM_44290 [Pseudomonas cichorii]|uniref:Uncharacterized protein n=1 Tax=Pseudomonas cichorii TaxID=36746 RepID=A0ABQ1DNP5_PSECI|nr:hypothetical protein PSCICM_44290 [Pseudomonas cichorii]GFM92457.1 hypothetical protein PSCICP_24290 [Pseudomonas cichorii]
MAQYGAKAYPGLVSRVKAAKVGKQYGEQAFTEVAYQGQDGSFFTGQTQHVGRACIARATGTWVRAAIEAAEQDGEGQ